MGAGVATFFILVNFELKFRRMVGLDVWRVSGALDGWLQFNCHIPLVVLIGVVRAREHSD